MVEGGGAPSQATGPTDEEIVAAIASGDTRVAAALYDRVAVVVDRTMYRVFGRREHDHDDLVQTAFEQIVRSLAREKFAGACSLTTWASTLATHVGLNALRSRQRERKVVNRDATPPDPEGRDVEREIHARAELEAVRDALAAMAPEKAETLFLHDVEGLDLAEIATLTRVTVAAAQSRLVRARRELAERVNGGDHE